MKKRLFSILLACCLITGIIPVLLTPAAAANVSDADIASLVATANGAVGKTAAQLGIQASDWCGYFVGYCINNSGISSRLGTIPSSESRFSISPAKWICITKDAGVYYSFSSAHSARLGELSSAGKIVSTNSSSFTPMVGDLVEFTWKPWSNHVFSHVGIVTAVNGDKITYVDGNSGNGKGKVASYTKDKTNSSIIGYIRFDCSAAANTTVMIPDGTYTLVPQCAPALRLDVSGGSTASKANIQIYQANNSNAQKFSFTYVEDGYYEIGAKVSGKVLDVYNGNTTSGTNVWQYDRNSSDAQRWALEDAGDGYYYIVPKVNTGLCLDVYNSGTKNGSNVQIWSKNQTAAQKWRILSQDGNPVNPSSAPNSLPTDLTIHINQDTYTLNTPVQIEPSATNATHYAISIWRGAFKTGERLYANFNLSGGITFTPPKPGTYTIRADAKNSVGYISAEKVFVVQQAAQTESPNSLPSGLTVSTDKSSYTLGESVSITPSASNATHYAVSIWRGAFKTGERLYANFNLSGGIAFTPPSPGTYTIRADAKNSAGYISTEKVFTVSEATAVSPATVVASGTWNSSLNVSSGSCILDSEGTLTIDNAIGTLYLLHGSGGILAGYEDQVKRVIIKEGPERIFNLCKDMKNLVSVELPSSLIWIDFSAFRDCTSLQNITIPANVSYISTSAFGGCTSLKNISVSPENAWFYSSDGIVYKKDTGEVVIYPEGRS